MERYKLHFCLVEMADEVTITTARMPTPRHLEDKESVESINHWWLLEESLVVNIPKLLSEGQVCGWISEIHS